MALEDAISPAIQKRTPTIGMRENLKTAILKLSENRSSALIVKDGEELVGILTDMDLMYGILKNKDLEATPAFRHMTACQLITGQGTRNPCVQLHASESVKNALLVMGEAGVHNLLVSCERMEGPCIVSVRDLLRLAVL